MLLGVKFEVKFMASSLRVVGLCTDTNHTTGVFRGWVSVIGVEKIRIDKFVYSLFF